MLEKADALPMVEANNISALTLPINMQSAVAAPRCIDTGIQLDCTQKASELLEKLQS